MKYQTLHTWSYHVVSKRQLNFYHVLVEQVDLVEIEENLTFAQSVCKEPDGSVTVILHENGHLQETIQELSYFFKDLGAKLVETPSAKLTTSFFDAKVIKEWYFSIMGAVALVLINDPLLRSFFTKKWEYMDARICTLYVEPFTFIFTKEKVKVIHPVSLQNFAMRQHAEKVAATAFSKILTILAETYPGCEGLAIQSYVKDKLDIAPEKFTNIVTTKSQTILPHELHIEIL